jgi:hypothetical protein
MLGIRASPIELGFAVRERSNDILRKESLPPNNSRPPDDTPTAFRNLYIFLVFARRRRFVAAKQTGWLLTFGKVEFRAGIGKSHLDTSTMQIPPDAHRIEVEQSEVRKKDLIAINPRHCGIIVDEATCIVGTPRIPQHVEWLIRFVGQTESICCGYENGHRYTVEYSCESSCAVYAKNEQ